MKHIKLFEDFLNEAKKPMIEVTSAYAEEAAEAFKDVYSKKGKMTSTKGFVTFVFKKEDDAVQFGEYLMDYMDIPETEITLYGDF
jgi:hypothetical protein